MTEKNCNTCKRSRQRNQDSLCIMDCVNFSHWEPKDQAKSCLTCELNYENFNRGECKVCRDYSEWVQKTEGEPIKEPIGPGVIFETIKTRPAAMPGPERRDPKARYYDHGGIETLDILKAKLTQEQYQGWLLGNVIKYSCRANYKDQFERDIEKTEFYSAELRRVQE